MDLEKLKKDTQVIIDDVIKQTEIKAGQVFVLGLSSSEVNGGLIGHASSSEIGQVIVSVIHKTLSDKGIYLAVQACEHLNRALLIEEELAEKRLGNRFCDSATPRWWKWSSCRLPTL